MTNNGLFRQLKPLVYFTLILLTCLMNGCTVLDNEQRTAAQQKLKNHTNKSIDDFIVQHPSLNDELKQAAGYMLCDTSRLMIVALGGQNGLCLLHDGTSDTILDLNSVNIGVGLGSTHSQFLALFKSTQALNEVKNGHFTVQLESLSKAGQQRNTHAQQYAQQIAIYSLNNEGSVASLGVGMLSLTVNKQLNTPDFATINVTNKTKSNLPKNQVWPYRMPFLAEQVIQQGYRLPKPYGVGVNVASIEQQLDLTALNVGFNGNSPVPFQFVDFENATTQLTTTQVKADMWLFPFMNVFAMMGKVDGDINMDVMLDGNLMLEHLGKDCQRTIKPIACRLLENQTFLLPIETKVDPFTYGIGAVFAGGWQDWFVAIPINLTWSKPKNALLDGNAFTITPRFGRVFNLKKLGRFSVFAGGNYLDSENSIQGRIAVPDGDFILDYEAEQANTDRWNIVGGFNWDISTTLSINLEFNGMTGSRDAVIAGVTLRL